MHCQDLNKGSSLTIQAQLRLWGRELHSSQTLGKSFLVSNPSASCFLYLLKPPSPLMPSHTLPAGPEAQGWASIAWLFQNLGILLTAARSPNISSPCQEGCPSDVSWRGGWLFSRTLPERGGCRSLWGQRTLFSCLQPSEAQPRVRVSSLAQGRAGDKAWTFRTPR